MTGGYLVLERPNAGIVLSTNARFYAVVKPLYDEGVEMVSDYQQTQDYFQ